MHRCLVHLWHDTTFPSLKKLLKYKIWSRTNQALFDLNKNQFPHYNFTRHLLSLLFVTFIRKSFLNQVSQIHNDVDSLDVYVNLRYNRKGFNFNNNNCKNFLVYSFLSHSHIKVKHIRENKKKYEI